MRWRVRRGGRRLPGAHSSERRVRREVAGVEHRPQQLGLGQHGLRLRHHVRGGMLGAGQVIVEPRKKASPGGGARKGLCYAKR